MKTKHRFWMVMENMDKTEGKGQMVSTGLDEGRP